MPAMYVRYVGSRARWFKDDTHEDSKDYTADALKDVNTSSSKLSVYGYESDMDLLKIMGSLASNRSNLDVMDFVYLKNEHIEELGVSVHRSDGATPCPTVNTMHYDIDGLTGGILNSLVSKVIWDSEEVKRYTKSEVREQIKKMRDNQELNMERIQSWVHEL